MVFIEAALAVWAIGSFFLVAPTITSGSTSSRSRTSGSSSEEERSGDRHRRLSHYQPSSSRHRSPSLERGRSVRPRRSGGSSDSPRGPRSSSGHSSLPRHWGSFATLPSDLGVDPDYTPTDEEMLSAFDKDPLDIIAEQRRQIADLQSFVTNTTRLNAAYEGALGENRGVNVNTCENPEARLAVDVPRSLPNMETAMHNARICPKPRVFDGSEGRRSSISFRDWFAEVQRFVLAVTWVPAAVVPTAAQYLVGDALRWWDKQRALLQRMGKDPTSWCTFADALFDRWAQKNEEAAARTQLHYLRQGKSTIHEHLRTFEALYALIPTYDPHSLDMERDKIHRFYLSCNSEWQNRVAVSPSGKKWQSFQEVASYVTNFESERHVDLIADTVAGVKPAPPRQPNVPNAPAGFVAGRRRGRSRSQGRGSRGDRSRSANDGAGPSNPAARGPNNTNGNKLRPFRNKNGVRFTRTHDEAEFCMSRHLCLCCWKEGEHVRDCTKAPARGPPPNFGQ